jgi:hypothetical protein
VEVNHAGEVSSATESRWCRALRQARQDEPEQAQRRIEKCMYKSMSEEQLDEFASTKRKGKPERAAKSRSKSASSRSSTRKSPARKKSTARKSSARQKSSR